MAIYNTTTNYPTSVDDLLFISDVDCKSENIMNTHQEYINRSKYTDASRYLNNQSNITPIVADLFNLLENRLIALQSHLLSQDDEVERAFYEEPESSVEGTIWIE